jgi:iron(III) transport system permease protein
MADDAATTWSKRGSAVLAAAALAALGLATGRLRGLFLNTALLAGGVLALALPIGLVLGLTVAKIELPGRRALSWLLVGLLFVPLYLQAGAWHSVFGPGGWWVEHVAGDSYADPPLAGWRGAIWVHAMAAVPWVALAVAAALATVERRLEEQALLEADGWRVLRRVSLRYAAGGAAAAAAWVAAMCATEFVVTDLYQVRTFAEEVYTAATLGLLTGAAPNSTSLGIPLGVAPAEPFAARDLALGVAALGLLLVAATWRAAPWLAAVATTPRDSTWRWRPQRRFLAAIPAWGLIAAVVGVPLAGLAWKAGLVVHQAGGAYVRSWSLEKMLALVARSPWDHRREWGWSLEIGAIAAVAATLVALAAAWRLRRRSPAAAPFVAGLALLAAIPAPLLAVWVIEAFNRPPGSPLAALAVLYDRTLTAPALVQAVRAAPLVTLWLWSQLASISAELFDAARCDGAGSWRQFWSIALPLRRPAIAAALAAGIAIALAELSATLLVLPPGVTTISVRVFQLLHYGVDDRVAALSLAIFSLIAGCVGVAAGGAALRRRRHRVTESRTG